MGILGFVGDIYLSRPQPGAAFDGIRAALGECDAIVGNLEGAVSDMPALPTAKPSSNVLCFRSAVAQLAALDGFPFAAFGLANNHILDFGVAPVEDTVGHLLQRGILSAGFGRNRDAAFAAGIVNCVRTPVALIAATCVFHNGWQATPETPGMATIRVSTSYDLPVRAAEQPGTPPVVRTRVEAESLELLRKAIREARATVGPGGIVIFGVHWGRSGSDESLEYQHEIAQLCADEGVNVVFGHGPHKVQAMGFIGSMPIMYSLGNFLMDLDLPASFGTYGALAQLSTEPGRELVIVPIARDGATPRPATSDEVNDFANELNVLSRPHGARLEVDAGRIVVRPL